jgi:ubiquinone/menaquinone biosynthesis C-methylase UbiE
MGETVNHDDFKEVRDLWNGAADDWKIQVGDDGDHNRRLNSDPVLWNFAGDVQGLTVLDAGCGTGYLTAKLRDRGARVIGVDVSESMVAIARKEHPDIDFRVDSCTELKTIDEGYFDRLISNYVLMDIPDLQSTVRAFHRVLGMNGVAVLVFSHPCFPAGRATAEQDGGCSYRWKSSYFEPQKCIDPPWGHFTSDFIWFHRPLSDYWKAFTTAGFNIVDFEEPRVTENRYHLALTDSELANSKSRPFSVAFKLQKIR